MSVSAIQLRPEGVTVTNCAVLVRMDALTQLIRDVTKSILIHMNGLAKWKNNCFKNKHKIQLKKETLSRVDHNRFERKIESNKTGMFFEIVSAIKEGKVH